ncbi:MAG: metallopeptidase family protein [Candidatus Kerfeldbacteria bacterium]|nr:metallopeptidase family protein [Candidatus Kerfeldbacteria bacterium]
MNRSEFEHSIQTAIADLPERIRKALNNVAFLVEGGERQPPHGTKGIRRGRVLLGLYEGVPLVARGAGYQWVLPDRITLFKDVIEELAGHDDEQVRTVVRDTVRHEIAHHLGFSELEVREWEKKRKRAS